MVLSSPSFPLLDPVANPDPLLQGVGSATAQRMTPSPPHLDIAVPLSYMGASASNPAASSTGPFASTPASDSDLDPTQVVPSPKRKQGSRVRPPGAAYIVRLTKTVAGGAGGSPFHALQQQRPGSAPFQSRQQQQQRQQRPGSSLPAVSDRPPAGQQLLPISEDARSGRLHGGGTLPAGRGGGGGGSWAISAQQQQRPPPRRSSGADSSAWVTPPSSASRPGAAYAPRRASEAGDFSSGGIPRLSSSGGGSPNPRRSLGLLRSSEESKTLKELSDAYSQAEQLTQELLAQAQRLLYAPPSTVLSSGSRPSSGRSAAAVAAVGGGSSSGGSSLPRPLSRVGSGTSGRLSAGGGVAAPAATLSPPPRPSPLQRSSSDAAAALPITEQPMKGISGNGSASRPVSATKVMAADDGSSPTNALAEAVGDSSRPGSGKAAPVEASVANSRPGTSGTAESEVRTRSSSGAAAPAALSVVPESTSGPLVASTVTLLGSRPNSGTTASLAVAASMAPPLGSRPNSGTTASLTVAVAASASASMLTMDEAALLSEALGEPPSPSSTAAEAAAPQQQVSA